MAAVPTQRPAGVGAYTGASQPESADEYVRPLADDPLANFPPPSPAPASVNAQADRTMLAVVVLVVTLVIAVVVIVTLS
jgi:hypothetical protein